MEEEVLLTPSEGDFPDVWIPGFLRYIIRVRLHISPGLCPGCLWHGNPDRITAKGTSSIQWLIVNLETFVPNRSFLKVFI